MAGEGGGDVTLPPLDSARSLGEESRTFRASIGFSWRLSWKCISGYLRHFNKKKNNKKTESSSETEGLSDFDRVSSFSVSRFHFKKSVQVVKPDRQQWLLSRSRTKCVIDSRPHIKTICGPETLLCFQRWRLAHASTQLHISVNLLPPNRRSLPSFWCRRS